MTSRERVRRTINREKTDCIPNGLGGCETEGLHVLSYYKLREVLGLPPAPPKICTFMTNAVFELDTIKKMKGDIILLASPRMCKSFYRGLNVDAVWKEQILWGKKFSVPLSDRFALRDDGSIIWETAGNAVCPGGGYFFDWFDSNRSDSGFYDDIDRLPSPDDYNPSHDLPDELLRKLDLPPSFFTKKRTCQYA